MKLFPIALYIKSLIFMVTAQHLNKCCKTGEILERVNGTFSCVPDETKRLQILVNDTNFISKNSDGECVEVSDGFFVFNVTGSVITQVSEAKDKVYPKCCPLNYIYNSKLRACQKHPNLDQSYIQEKFIRVGVRHCKIVLDHNLNGTVDYHYSLLDSPKYLRNSLENVESYCLDKNEEDSFTIRECQESIEICEEIRCIKKCCPDGQTFVDGPHCKDTYEHSLNLSSWTHVIEHSTEPFVIINNNTCHPIYILRYNKLYNFTLDQKGVFHFWNEAENHYDHVSKRHSYCIEHVNGKNNGNHLFFKCSGQPPEEVKYRYTLITLIISCVFLLMTILIYILLGEIKKMFGKILVNYCIAMLIQFAVLSYSASRNTPTPNECEARAFSILFFAVSSFTWSNILCWDIWCTFGSTRRYVVGKQWTIDLKKLGIYSIYGWGAPLILTLIVYLFHSNEQLLPYSIRPILAQERCFFEMKKGNYGKHLFLNFPLLIIQLINTVLFVKTAIYCIRVKNEINRINDTTRESTTRRFQKDKERSFLILKLLIVMGISFAFEVVTGFFETDKWESSLKYLEIVWDCFNALQGVFIFMIFVCKKKIFREFVNKFSSPRMSRMSVGSLHTQSTSLNGIAMNAVGTKNGK